MTDTERIDALERMMSPDDNYCEIFFAGLRNWTGKAEAFQVESNPERFATLNRPTLREAIDEAIRLHTSNPTGLRCAGLGAHKQDPVVGQPELTKNGQ